MYGEDDEISLRARDALCSSKRGGVDLAEIVDPPRT